jgi:hypothetical protein
VRYAIQDASTKRQMQGVSAIATPLLAAGALAVAGVAAQEADTLRFANLTLSTLILATVAFISSVTSSIWVSHYTAEPVWPYVVSIDPPPMSDADYSSATGAYAVYTFWVNVSRRSFNVGLYSLLAGISLWLTPERITWRSLPVVVFPLAAIVVDIVLPRAAPKGVVEPTVWLAAMEGDP